jgi:glycosyltransferase involved in cell wall biosynthesis/capsular polysaccharide biosynthesis protein
MIGDKQKRLTEISHQLSVTNFIESAPSPYDKLLEESQQALSIAQRARLEAEANLELFVNPKLGKITEALEATVADIVYKDQGLQSLKANMYERRSKLVEQISGLDPKHPGYEQIKKQLAVIEAEVVEATDQLSQDIEHMLLEERSSKVTLTKQIEESLLKQIAEQKQRAAWFSQIYNEALIINQDIHRLHNQLETVENRIGFIELESKAPGFVRIESYAKPPEIPVRGGRKKIFIMVVMVGIVLGGMAPIVIDLMDRRIRTAGQVEKLLGYKPLAALMDPHQEGISPAMLTDQRRRLLLALNRDRLDAGKSSYVIALTAVGQNSAVTSLAFDLANDCQRIHFPGIVVEVNTFRPDNRYCCAGHITLHELLTSDVANLEQAIAHGDGEYPDRIAIGVPAGSLMSGYQQLQRVLTKLQEKYTFIFLDTAPVLWSADSEYFTGIADITLLLIAAYQTQPGQITRAVNLLERLDPKAISFIVTRLLMFKGGGYYTKVFTRTEVNVVINRNADLESKARSIQKTQLLYLLHSGNLYGTERMALATLEGLRPHFRPVLLAPPGPVHRAAEQMGIASHVFTGKRDLFKQLPRFLKGQKQIALCATGVSHSLLFLLVNLGYRVRNVHLHLVHGGTDERLSYGRKKLLNRLPVTLIAVSEFVKSRLLAYGVAEGQVKVLENFLPDDQIQQAPKRATFTEPGIKRVLLISRVDPIKRIDLLLDALDLEPALQNLTFRILGTGWDLDNLRQRARLRHPNVTFIGFSDQVPLELAKSDLLLHTCPEEPFGLAILEAMAAKVPVLLPDQGGAAVLIPAATDIAQAAGLHFNANDAHDLAQKLMSLQLASTEQLNQMVDRAYQHLWEHYSSQARLPAYQAQFAELES